LRKPEKWEKRNQSENYASELSEQIRKIYKKRLEEEKPSEE